MHPYISLELKYNKFVINIEGVTNTPQMCHDHKNVRLSPNAAWEFTLKKKSHTY